MAIELALSENLYNAEEQLNERGFMDYGFWEKGNFVPVCKSCGCYKHMNNSSKESLNCSDCDTMSIW